MNRFRFLVQGCTLCFALFAVGCETSTAEDDSPAAADAGTSSTASSGASACSVPAIAITHAADAGAASAPVVRVLPAATYPDAVCNDGTQAYYVFRPGTGAGVNRWILYLEGGGYCATDAECAERYRDTPHYMTSSYVTDGQTYKASPLEGIKSADPKQNPDFYDANYVQLVYCSSDAWSGDVAADATQPATVATHWAYRGRTIVTSVIADLKANRGLSSATEVLVAGSSAGGIGTLQRVDDIGALVSPARFLGLMDAGFFLDFPSYQMAAPLTPSLRRQDLTAGVQLWGGGGDASCEAAATTLDEHVDCRAADALFRNGFIATPMFIRQSLLDNIQLSGLGLDSMDTSAAASAYRASFATELVNELTPLSDPSAAQGVTVYASKDDQHGVINDNQQWREVSADGASLPPTIGAWYQDPCSATSHIAAP
jgi:hypothetical protein